MKKIVALISILILLNLTLVYAALPLKQSTAANIMIGPFLDSSDGNTVENGLTISFTDVYVSKNGLGLSPKNDANAATYNNLGFYECSLNTTDTDTLGRLEVMIHESGALSVVHEFTVMTANLYDSWFSTDKQEVDIAQVGGDNITDNNDGRLEVNVEEIEDNDDSQGVIDFECDEALGNIQLDHWMNSACTGSVITGNVVDNSALALMLTDDGDISAYDKTTDSNEALGTDTDAIVADTGTDGVAIADGYITAAKLATNCITNDEIATTAGDEIADEVWDEVLTAATHNVSTSAGRRLRQLESTITRYETAQAGAAQTITLDASASTTDDTYNGNSITLISGTGAGQTRCIVDYDQATKVATVNHAWITNPDNTSVFAIVAASHGQNITCGLATAGAANTITLENTASATGDLYNDCDIQIMAGTGAGQARLISDYAAGTYVATVTPNWITNPDNTSVYAIWEGTRTNVAQIAGTAQSSNVGDNFETFFENGGSATAQTVDDVGGGSIPTVAQIADGVWDEANADHVAAGSTGNKLNAAGTAADPWSTSIPGSYTAGTAGYIMGNTLVGPGAGEATLTVKTTGGTAIDNVKVWLTTDEAGTARYSGPLYTASDGTVDFMVDEDVTYYVWRERAGYTFSNPQTWTP
jgi:hypothetical protein